MVQVVPYTVLILDTTLLPTPSSFLTPLYSQIIGGPNRDRLTIAVARALEKEFGGVI